MNRPRRRGLIVTAALVVITAGLVQAARFAYPLKYERLILRHAQQQDLEPALLAAIVYEESKFDRHSKSSAGAVGLMQVMPKTAGWAAQELGRPELAARLTVPEANLAIGSWYFRRLLDLYGSTALALAAYNGGQRNLDKWLAQTDGRGRDDVIDRIPFSETKTFVRRTERSRRIYRWLYFCTY